SAMRSHDDQIALQMGGGSSDLNRRLPLQQMGLDRNPLSSPPLGALLQRHGGPFFKFLIGQRLNRREVDRVSQRRNHMDQEKGRLQLPRQKNGVAQSRLRAGREVDRHQNFIYLFHRNSPSTSCIKKSAAAPGSTPGNRPGCPDGRPARSKYRSGRSPGPGSDGAPEEGSRSAPPSSPPRSKWPVSCAPPPAFPSDLFRPEAGQGGRIRSPFRPGALPH